ncbi:MAG: hypothetical protein LUI08_01370 [Prevotella sp.]|nr:hypothetical protein [Prevotella sp.]
MLRRTLILSLSLLVALAAKAQSGRPFERTVYCDDFNIFIVMNFYDKNITIAGQEFMGEMDGYIGDKEDFRAWFILDSRLVSDDEATLDIINTEGSEDLTATLTHNADGTFTLRQTSGAVLKIARGQKWQKLPKTLVFTTKAKE